MLFEITVDFMFLGSLINRIVIIRLLYDLVISLYTHVELSSYQKFLFSVRNKPM